MADTKKDLDETKRLMGALVRMKPEPHEEMKVKKRTKAASDESNARPRSRQKINKNRKSPKASG
jgi:hypothetical protein